MDNHFSNTEAYENFMGRWSVRLAPLFLEFAGLPNGERVLDVGCGTGALSRAVVGASPSSEVVGVDPSEPFIDNAQAYTNEPGIRYEIGNALNLPYPDGAFGQTLSMLVLMLIPEAEKAASEMRRVTRPGGSAAACNWDSGGDGLELINSFWEEAVRLDSSAERLDTNLKYNRRGELTELWKMIGLESVEEETIEFRMNFTSFDDYWLPYLQGVGPTGAYVKDLPPEGLEALRVALRNRLLGGKEDGPFSLGARAWAVRGTVPE